MGKKEYVLLLLERLSTNFPAAEGLKYLIESNSVDEGLFNILSDVLEYAIKNADSDLQKDKLQRGIDILEKIRAQEIAAHEKDEEQANKEIDELMCQI